MDRLLNVLMGTLQLDSTDDTREVSADVETPEEIDANINPTITYQKVCFRSLCRVTLVLSTSISTEFRVEVS